LRRIAENLQPRYARRSRSCGGTPPQKGRSPAARAGRRGTCGRTHYWLGPRSGARLIVYTPADSDSRDRLEKPVASL